MKRAAVLLLVMVLAGCSSKAKAPAGAGTPSASTSPASSAAAGASASASPHSISSNGTVAVPSSSRSGTAKTSPRSAIAAPGTYHYTQNGNAQAGPFSFTADPTGTLAIGAPVTDGTAKREQQDRTYSSSWSQQQILLFRSDAVLIKQLTTRFGSGAFVQEDTCTPSHPLKAIELPLVVNNTWSDSATCNGRTLTISGKVLRTETRTVGGKAVATDVVNLVTREAGNGYDVTLNLTMWIAPAYGLSVHSTETGSGSAQGSSFSESLTEDLVRLTPDP